MLNKELLMMLTPTDEEGIFLLTVGEGTREFGYIEADAFGDFNPKDNVAIFGEGGNECFQDAPVKLISNIKSHYTLAFPNVHKPNRSDLTIWLHYRTKSSGINSVSFYFDLNFDMARNTGEPYQETLEAFSGETIRVYLGPSPIPPPISLRNFLREVLYVK